MDKKLTGKALAKFEAERDVWQEVLEGVREIKAGGGKRTKVKPKSHGNVHELRLTSRSSMLQEERWRFSSGTRLFESSRRRKATLNCREGRIARTPQELSDRGAKAGDRAEPRG